MKNTLNQQKIKKVIAVMIVLAVLTAAFFAGSPLQKEKQISSVNTENSEAGTAIVKMADTETGQEYGSEIAAETEIQSETGTENITEAESGTEKESAAETEPETGSEPETESEREKKEETKTETAADADSGNASHSAASGNSKSEAGSTGSKTDSSTDSKTDSSTDSKTDSSTDSKAGSSGSKTGSSTGSKTDSSTGSSSGSKTDSSTDSKAGSSGSKTDSSASGKADSSTDSSGGSTTDSETKTVTHTCTLSISCKTVLNNMDSLDESKKGIIPESGVIMSTITCTFDEGDTVYDVLKRECRSRGISMEGSGSYVEGIANLYEFDCGSGSGWMYSVNGSFSNVDAGSYTLSDGDSIKWLYTCSLGDDL